MPPMSNMRKTSVATATPTHVNDPASAPRRTTSGRAVRANATRPTNYYARPFASSTAAASNNAADNDGPNDSPAGFFPALQYFSDAITALPKEVMRQFTLMKEVEAKIHGPNEQLGEVIDALMEYEVPARPARTGGMAGAQAMLSLTASNSVVGSTAASVVNGFRGSVPRLSAQNSTAGSVTEEDATQASSGEDMLKRQKYHELRTLTHSLLANLDEKNVVLAEANRVLGQQLTRIDSVLHHIDNEISEEARLGSMTHWAYSDNRQKKQVVGTAANRRDVAATNNLVAAAHAVHESDIAKARTEPIKQKGRGREHVDSDFDDKPKKTRPKFGNNKNMGAAGLGISNATLHDGPKRRKVDKALVPPILERMQSSAKGTKTARETPRSTPAAEPVKKPRAKPALPAKKKNLNSSRESPALASSPVQPSSTMEPPNVSARMRTNSTATKLRHERTVEEKDSRPPTASGKVNGERLSSKRKAPVDAQEHVDTVEKTTETADKVKHEDTEMADNERGQQSGSGSNSGKAGRGSKISTPRTDGNPEGGASMVRTRSIRSMREAGDGSSSEPQSQGIMNRHKRVNSHLVKQLAPFNRSPDLDRHKDDEDEDGASPHNERRVEQEEQEPDEPAGSPPKRRPSSRRNTTVTHVTVVSSPPPMSEHADEDVVMPDVEPEEPEELEPEAIEEDVPEPEPEIDNSHIVPDEVEPEAEVEDEDSEPGGMDDPDDQKYCCCNRGSYGEMIACDNEQCPREWYHLGCTELKGPPDEEEKWYCKECRPLFNLKKGRGKGRGAVK